MKFSIIKYIFLCGFFSFNLFALESLPEEIPIDSYLDQKSLTELRATNKAFLRWANPLIKEGREVQDFIDRIHETPSSITEQETAYNLKNKKIFHKVRIFNAFLRTQMQDKISWLASCAKYDFRLFSIIRNIDQPPYRKINLELKPFESSFDTLSTFQDKKKFIKNLYSSKHFTARNLLWSKFFMEAKLHNTPFASLVKITPDNLKYACKYGVMPLLLFLIENHIDLSSTFSGPCVFNQTTLQIAAENGHEDIIDLLIEKKQNVNRVDFHGWSALHFSAMMNDHPNAVNALLKAGANPNSVGPHSFRPLHFAAIDGNEPIIGALLKAGANPNTTDSELKTPLYFAAANGHQNVIHILLNAGADPNIATLDGTTPLHMAVIYRHIPCIVTLRDITQADPYEIIKHYVGIQRPDIAQVLLANTPITTNQTRIQSIRNYIIQKLMWCY